jgi:hypothetical protein
MSAACAKPALFVLRAGSNYLSSRTASRPANSHKWRELRNDEPDMQLVEGGGGSVTDCETHLRAAAASSPPRSSLGAGGRTRLASAGRVRDSCRASATRAAQQVARLLIKTNTSGPDRLRVAAIAGKNVRTSRVAALQTINRTLACSQIDSRSAPPPTGDGRDRAGTTGAGLVLRRGREQRAQSTGRR